MIDVTLTSKQEELRDAIRGVAKGIIRPQSLAWDRAHGIPEEFLQRFTMMANSMGGTAASWGVQGLAADEKPKEGRKKTAMVSTVISAEELSWGDPALLLCLPGPGLGGPPVRGSGTPEQKERFLSIFQDMSGGLKWGAYALTEPGAGSDVAGIRTSCRREGDEWVLNGRKCYITNGGRASWNVVFATVDPSLGRAGHRAFVVEKGTPGFSVGKIEEKMGLRAAACRRRTSSAARSATKRRRASSRR
jgi:acyl-CoA dehydrogenase